VCVCVCVCVCLVSLAALSLTWVFVLSCFAHVVFSLPQRCSSATAGEVRGVNNGTAPTNTLTFAHTPCDRPKHDDT
jgi:hypothetical protein